MKYSTAPLSAVVDGSARALQLLPTLATSATLFGVPFRVIHQFDESKNPRFRGVPAQVQRLERAVAGIDALASVEVRTVHPKELLSELNQLAQEEGGGILGLPRTRRTLLGQLRGRNGYEQLLRTTPLAVLPLASRQALTTLSHVLFPADLSSRSMPMFEETVQLCAAKGSTLHLLHVFGRDRPLRDAADRAVRAAAATPGTLARLDEERLAAMVAQATDLGVPTEAHTAEGRAHRAIVAYVKQHPIDLIVMPSHGVRSSEDVIRGSTTVRVIQNSPTPVLAMRSRWRASGHSTG